MTEPGMPCGLCGAARSCQHREVEPPIQMVTKKTDTGPNLIKPPRDYTGNGYNFKRVKVSGGGTYFKKKRSLATDDGKNSGVKFRI